MQTGFEQRHLYAAVKLTLTHFYEPGETTTEQFGTGFLVSFPEGDPRFALVTNRHLVDLPWSDAKYDGTRLTSIKVELWQAVDLRIEFPIDDPELLFHDDQSIDVAVVPFGPQMHPKLRGYPYDKLENLIPDPNVDFLEFRHAVGWQDLEKYEQLWPLLRPGEMVTFPGYPAWYDKSEVRPVFRSGVIASDPQKNYRQRDEKPSNRDGNQQILFDAFSTSGNSGSPVFVAQRGIAPFDLKMNLGQAVPQQAAKLEFSDYHQAFLIGINAGHFNDLDQAPNHHAGLSRMHKLSAIMEILRANTVPSTDQADAKLFIANADLDALEGPNDG